MPNQAKGRFVVLGQEDLRAALDSEGLIGVLDPGSVLGEEVEALLGHQPETEAVKVDRPLVALQLQLDSLVSLDSLDYMGSLESLDSLDSLDLLDSFQ